MTAMMIPIKTVVTMRKCPITLRSGSKPQLLIDRAGENRARLFIVDRMLMVSMKMRAREAVVWHESA